MPVPTKDNVSRPLAYGYDVLIEYGSDPEDSLYLRAAVGPGRQLTFQTVDPQPQGPSTVENPEDMRSESGQTASRSDFSGGEGLRFAHRRNGTDFDFSRFYDSRGVVVAPDSTGQPQPLRLSRSVSVVSTSNGSRWGCLQAAIDPASGASATTRLWYSVQAVEVFRSDDPLAATFSLTQEDSDDGESHVFKPNGTLALLDDQLYTAYAADGIHRRTDLTATPTWEHWSDLSGVQRIWAIKGRILAALAGGLYEAAAGADSTLIFSFDSQHHVTDVADAGSVILVGCTNGTIYHLAEEDGELILAGETRFEGETPYAVAAQAGVVLIGTQKPGRLVGITWGPGRLWRAAVTGQRLTGLQLLREWGEPGDLMVYRPFTFADADSIYVGVQESSSEIAVWRYVLSTGGLYRHLSFAPPNAPNAPADIKNPSDIEIVDGRLFVALNSDDLVREDATYVDEGYLISPLFDFYNDDTKAWREVRLRLGNMPEGTSVSLEYSTDPAAVDDPAHSSWTTAISQATTSGEHTKNLVGVEGRWLALKVVLETTDPDETPEVLAFAARGLLKPAETDWQVPINVSDRLELPHRKPLLVPGLGEQVRDAMQALVGKVVTVTLLRPDEKVVGQIVGVSEPIQELPERGSPSVYALLTVRGERQAS